MTATQLDGIKFLVRSAVKACDKNGRNFVAIHAVKAWMRAETSVKDMSLVDLAINSLRRDWVLTMDSYEGVSVRLSADEIASGITEGNSLLYWISFR